MAKKQVNQSIDSIPLNNRLMNTDISIKLDVNLIFYFIYCESITDPPPSAFDELYYVKLELII